MRDYLLILEVAARRFYEKIASRDERHRLDEILQNLMVDPFVDRVTRFGFDYPPMHGAIYSDGEFWVVYEVQGPGSILIWNIGFEHETPSPDRDEPPL